MSNRRARVRATTMAEIRATARELLVSKGPTAVTVNAIAREMGMSGPAVYRYYGSLEELVQAVVAGIYHDVTAHLITVRDDFAIASPGDRLLALCRSLRSWAVEHPAEFSWAFTQGAVSLSAVGESELRRAGEQFESVFRHEFELMWETTQFPTKPADELRADLLTQLQAYVKRSGTSLPPEAAEVFLSCWIRVYGLLMMDLMGQLRFAFEDAGPAYEAGLEELCNRIGIVYRS